MAGGFLAVFVNNVPQCSIGSVHIFLKKSFGLLNPQQILN